VVKLNNEENGMSDDKKDKNSLFKYLKIIRIIILIPVLLFLIHSNGKLEKNLKLKMKERII